jgi:hypothetical protein
MLAGLAPNAVCDLFLQSLAPLALRLLWWFGCAFGKGDELIERFNFEIIGRAEKSLERVDHSFNGAEIGVFEAVAGERVCVEVRRFAAERNLISHLYRRKYVKYNHRKQQISQASNFTHPN